MQLAQYWQWIKYATGQSLASNHPTQQIGQWYIHFISVRVRVFILHKDLPVSLTAYIQYLSKMQTEKSTDGFSNNICTMIFLKLLCWTHMNLWRRKLVPEKTIVDGKKKLLGEWLKQLEPSSLSAVAYRALVILVLHCGLVTATMWKLFPHHLQQKYIIVHRIFHTLMAIFKVPSPEFTFATQFQLDSAGHRGMSWEQHEDCEKLAPLTVFKLVLT